MTITPPSGALARNSTMAEAAADTLRQRILSGEFPEGTQLKQTELANALGISRIPLREALVQLEGEGLVRIVAHKGAIVAEMSTAEVAELFQLRALLEPLLLKKSVPKLTEVDFVELDSILSQYSNDLYMHQAPRYGQLNTQLHDVMLSRADQPKTRAIVNGLLLQTDRYTRLQLSLSLENAERAEREHAELVRRCRERDARGAASLLKQHIEQAGSDLIAFITTRRRL